MKKQNGVSLPEFARTFAEKYCKVCSGGAACANCTGRMIADYYNNRADR
jgi:hypothetical protein